MNGAFGGAQHSSYGHTAKVAEAVAANRGAQLLAVDAKGNLPEGRWAALAAAKWIVFGSPSHRGRVSWQFKKFADASSRPWVGTGLMPANSKTASRADTNNLGSFADLMAATTSNARADETVAGDIAIARQFGARLAATVARLAAWRPWPGPANAAAAACRPGPAAGR